MKQLKLDDFLSYRFLSNLNWSPEGTKAATVVTMCDAEENSYTSTIWLYKDHEWKQLTGLGKEAAYVWEDDTHILFPAVRSSAEKKQKEAGDQFTTYYRLSTEGGEAVKAFSVPFAATGLKRVDEDLWAVTGSIDANYPDYYQMTKEERAQVAKHYKDNADYEVLTEIPFYANGGGFVDKKRNALFLVNAATGETERITAPLCTVNDTLIWGKTVYFLGTEKIDMATYSDSDLYKYEVESKTLTQLTHGEKSFMAIQVMGDKLITAASDKLEYQMGPEEKFYTVDTETGALTLFADNEDSLGNSTGSDCRYGHGRSFKAVGDSLYVIKTMRNAAHLYKLNADGTMEAVITKEGSVDDFDVTADGKILVNGMYDGKLQEVYAFDGALEQVSSFNEEILKDVYVADYNKMTIQSRGWDIDGWVLLPKDYDENKTYPAILDIHGGPRTVYGEIFYHEMQLWANQGFFVFFCNPVGGSGRGLAFADICDKYGEIDYENIMDFTDAVLEKYPQIDKTRVGCTGGSYGGFMSNWIMGHTDRFAAIATQRSISNWISFYGVSDIGFNFSKSQMGADIYSDEGIKQLWRHSPLRYVNNAKTPTLFIHSDEDYRCPMEQGMQLFTALKERGIPARLCYFKGENHELSRSGKPLHRVRRLTEITDWLTKYTTK